MMITKKWKMDFQFCSYIPHADFMLMLVTFPRNRVPMQCNGGSHLSRICGRTWVNQESTLMSSSPFEHLESQRKESGRTSGGINTHLDCQIKCAANRLFAHHLWPLSNVFQAAVKSGSWWSSVPVSLVVGIEKNALSSNACNSLVLAHNRMNEPNYHLYRYSVARTLFAHLWLAMIHW